MLPRKVKSTQCKNNTKYTARGYLQTFAFINKVDISINNFILKHSGTKIVT